MDRSDVFLSYRRADVEFTKRLYEKLKVTNRAVWVDWENLPPGVEGFSDEIQRGIEGADAFICILTPSYLESEYCLMELREALKLKKRVIPIVWKKFDPLPPPEGIGHINWIYFTPHAGQRNKFEDSLPKVIKALEADYEHTREHTRLLLRAIDWEKNEKNSSYLLKDDELGKAERWQVAATGKNPAPTELQGEYILASRAYQRKYQRRLTSVFGILMVFAVLAAIFAVLQRNDAVSSEQEAISQKNIALTEEARANAERAIAQTAQAEEAVARAAEEAARMDAEEKEKIAQISGLSAQSQITQSRQLRILMALEAYRVSRDKGELKNPTVETSLRGALVDFTGLPVHSYGTRAAFVRFTQLGDRRLLISASGNGQVQISDLTEGLDSEPVTLINRGLENIVLSPDGQWLAGTVGAFESGEEEIRLWDLNDPQAEPVALALPAGARGVMTLSFHTSSARYWLAAGLNDGSVHRWDLLDLPQIDHEELYSESSGRGVTALAFSPNGLWMAVAFSSNPSGEGPLMLIWDTQNFAGESMQIDLRGVTVTHLEFNSSSKWLAGISDDGFELNLWNVTTGSENPPAQALDVEGVNAIAFSLDERWVAVAQESKVEVWDLKRLFEDGIDLPGYKDLVLTVAFSQDSRQLATGDLDGQVHLWNTADFSDDDPPEESEARVYNSFDVTVSSLDFNSDSSQLAAAGDEQVRVWSFPETLSAPVQIADPLSVSALQDVLLIQPSSDRLFVMDLRGADPTIVLETEQPGGLEYFVSPDERYLAVISNRTIEIWDLQNPSEPIFPATEQEGRVVAPTFSADSRWFVYAVYADILAVDLQAPESSVQLTGNRNGSPVSEFFTMDHWLFSKSTSEVLAWDTSASSLSEPIRVSTSATAPSVYPLEEDSTWIFVQQSLILSAWNTAEPEVDPVGFEGEFWEVIDDRWLITTSDDNQLRLRDLSNPEVVLLEFADYDLSESRRWLFYDDEDGALQLVDLESSDPQPVALESLAGGILSFSPDDRWLAIPSQAGDAVALYDLTDDLQAFELSGYDAYLFSPDGHWLVTMTQEGDSFFLHNLTNESPTMERQFDEGPFSFSPDSRWLVTTEADGNSTVLYELTGDVSQVEVPDYQPISFPDEHWLILQGNTNGEETALFDLQNRELFQVTYPAAEILETSPDGRWLYGILSGGGRTDALLIDLNNPENFFPLTGHTDELIEIDLTPDGRSLLTYGHDRTIRIWDLENPAGDPVVLPHEEAVYAVNFTENGEWLISETFSDMYIWPWALEDVHTLACRLVGRNLTVEEWQKYIGGTDREQTCSQWP